MNLLPIDVVGANRGFLPNFVGYATNNGEAVFSFFDRMLELSKEVFMGMPRHQFAAIKKNIGVAGASWSGLALANDAFSLCDSIYKCSQVAFYKGIFRGEFISQVKGALVGVGFLLGDFLGFMGFLTVSRVTDAVSPFFKSVALTWVAASLVVDAYDSVQVIEQGKKDDSLGNVNYNKHYWKFVKEATSLVLVVAEIRGSSFNPWVAGFLETVKLGSSVVEFWCQREIQHIVAEQGLELVSKQGLEEIIDHKQQ